MSSYFEFKGIRSQSDSFSKEGLLQRTPDLRAEKLKNSTGNSEHSCQIPLTIDLNLGARPNNFTASS